MNGVFPPTVSLGAGAFLNSVLDPHDAKLRARAIAVRLSFRIVADLLAR